MRFLDKILGRDPVDVVQVAVESPVPTSDIVKTGEQLAKLADPQGKRIYYELFIDASLCNGSFPWTARVYDTNGLRSENSGITGSRSASYTKASNWAQQARQHLLEQQ